MNLNFKEWNCIANALRTVLESEENTITYYKKMLEDAPEPAPCYAKQRIEEATNAAGVITQILSKIENATL